MIRFLKKLLSPVAGFHVESGRNASNHPGDLMWVANRETARETRHQLQTGDPFCDPLARLTEARTRGRRLSLPIRLESLARIREWLEKNDPFTKLDAGSMHLLAAALHEASANIIEHGYGGTRAGEFELWWVARTGSGNGEDGRLDCRNPLKNSYFLILDHGMAFSADDREETDFMDPEAWRRGRGLGLDIIFRVMTRVAYRPATTQGNITLLAFDPGELTSNERQLRHA